MVSTSAAIAHHKKMKHRREIIFTATVMFFAGCASEHTAMSQSEGNFQPVISPVRNSVSPNHCRIVGTVVAVDSTLDVADSLQSHRDVPPCTKVPCNADVRIDSILGYGSAFGNPVVQEKIYRMHFVFTLAATSKELFPSMKEVYPGLIVGSSFIADIERQSVRGATQSMAPVFVIYGYSRLSESPH